MQWALDNWIWLLLGGGMFAMHLFGHGGHGGKKGHGESGGGKSCCGGASKAKPESGPSVLPSTKSRPKIGADVGAANAAETPRDL